MFGAIAATNGKDSNERKTGVNQEPAKRESRISSFSNIIKTAIGGASSGNNSKEKHPNVE